MATDEWMARTRDEQRDTKQTKVQGGTTRAFKRTGQNGERVKKYVKGWTVKILYQGASC